MTRVLVPVKVLEGESVSPGLIDLLGTMDTVVLGYHVVPEQTPPDQARAQYEERATDALEDLTGIFRAAGGDVDHRLVFTHDREQTFERVADEVSARAFGFSGITGDIDDLLVSLSGDVAVSRILSFVGELIDDREVGVTLFLATKDDKDTDETLESAARTLRDAGVNVTTVSATGDSFASLIEAASEHDAVVVGENAPSFRTLVFGDEADRVASESVGPVIVVRYDKTLDGGTRG
jgi:nucleotide-binding universal stress UspA family protein